MNFISNSQYGFLPIHLTPCQVLIMELTHWNSRGRLPNFFSTNFFQIKVFILSSFPSCHPLNPLTSLRHYFNSPQPFACSSLFANSFFPTTIKLWNSLPNSTKTTQPVLISNTPILLIHNSHMYM